MSGLANLMATAMRRAGEDVLLQPAKGGTVKTKGNYAEWTPDPEISDQMVRQVVVPLDDAKDMTAGDSFVNVRSKRYETATVERGQYHARMQLRIVE